MPRGSREKRASEKAGGSKRDALKKAEGTHFENKYCFLFNLDPVSKSLL